MSEHIHNVYDTDLRFTIDPVTRAITNASGKSVLIQGDHGSERATFELPKVIEGHDMTQCNKVRVQYINTGAKPGEVSADAYDVTDLAATSATSDKLTCSWLIEHPATKYAGKLTFLLEFLCLDGTAITYAWHTDKCEDLVVKSGINALEAIEKEYPDIIAKWEARVTAVEAAVGLIVEDDGAGNVKIAKAKATDVPDTPDEPAEPVYETVTVESTADDSGRHILEVSGVDEGTELAVVTTGSKVLCLHNKNLFPNNEWFEQAGNIQLMGTTGQSAVVFNDDGSFALTGIVNFNLPFELPAGAYILTAEVELDETATANPTVQISNATSKTERTNVAYAGYYDTDSDGVRDYWYNWIPPLYNPSTFGLSGNRRCVRFFTKSPTNQLGFMTQAAGTSWGVTNTYRNVCLMPVALGTGIDGEDYTAKDVAYAGDYTGVVYAAGDPVTVNNAPLYILADDGGAISASYEREVVTPDEPTIDEDTGYVTGLEIDSLTIENRQYTSFPDKYARQEIENLKENGVVVDGVEAKNWVGKTWVCIGDSLTQKMTHSDKYYHEYVAEETGITVTNMGLGGSGYKKREDENFAFYQRIANVPANADVVTIFGSGNDIAAYTYTSPTDADFLAYLGTETDTGTDTVCGCINTTIDNLYAKYPAVRLGIVSPTPWQHKEPTLDCTMVVYCDKLKAICHRRGIPFLDLFRCSGFRPSDETYRSLVFSGDGGAGVHPNALGHALIAPRFVAFLETLIGNAGGAGSTTDEAVATPLPEHWASYMPEKVGVINQLIEDTSLNGDAFIFITDQHMEANRNAGNSTALIKYISDNTQVRKLFSGGDICVTKEGLATYVEGLNDAFNGDIHYAMGNHEYDLNGSGVKRITDAELFNIHDMHKASQIAGSASRHYYYVDNPQQKMRYIVLNNWAHDETAVLAGTVGYGVKASDLATQAEWLTSTALNVCDGWGVVVFCHAYFDKYGNVEDAATEINTAINGYNGNGEIIAVFHGHQHWDYVNHTTSGVPVISTTSDKYLNTWSSGYEYQLTRNAGTITEHAFDVVIVDRTASKLHCVRIGADAVGANEDGVRVVDFRATT